MRSRRLGSARSRAELAGQPGLGSGSQSSLDVLHFLFTAVWAALPNRMLALRYPRSRSLAPIRM